MAEAFLPPSYTDYKGLGSHDVRYHDSEFLWSGRGVCAQVGGRCVVACGPRVTGHRDVTSRMLGRGRWVRVEEKTLWSEPSQCTGMLG